MTIDGPNNTFFKKKMQVEHIINIKKSIPFLKIKSTTLCFLTLFLFTAILNTGCATKVTELTQNVTPEKLDELAAGNSIDSKMLVAIHSNTKAATLKKLASDDNHGIRSSVALNNNTDLETLKILSEDKIYSVRESVAGNKNSSDEILIKLAVDKNRLIRISVAKNPSLANDAVLKRLAGDKDTTVRKIIAQRNNISEELLNQLAADSAENVRRAVFNNPAATSLQSKLKEAGENTSPDKLDKLADNPSITIRAAVAKNNNTSGNTLKKLASDKKISVVKSVLRNPNVEVATLEVLSVSDNSSIRMAVAENKNVTTEILSKLGVDKNVSVKSAVAKNQSTSSVTLRKLASDKNNHIRVAITENVNITAEILAALSDDREVSVKTVVAGHKKTPAKPLELLSTDKHPSVRLQVANNKNTSIETLKFLTGDKEKRIKTKASRTLAKLLGKSSDNSTIVTFDKAMDFSLSNTVPLTITLPGAYDIKSFGNKEKKVILWGNPDDLDKALQDGSFVAGTKVGFFKAGISTKITYDLATEKFTDEENIEGSLQKILGIDNIIIEKKKISGYSLLLVTGKTNGKTINRAYIATKTDSNVIKVELLNFAEEKRKETWAAFTSGFKGY